MQASPAFALHGDPINPGASGVAQHYGLLGSSREPWAQRLNNALVKIDCGTGNSRSAHLAREADGRVRIYTTWHGVAGLVSPGSQQIASTCRILFGPEETSLRSCRMDNMLTPTRENPVRMYRRYYEQFQRGEFDAMFETTRVDWTRFDISCSGDARGATERALLEGAALPVLGRSVSEIEAAIGQSNVQFVSVGAITLGHNNEPRVFSAIVAPAMPGGLDEQRTRAHDACVFSNYADVGMSGGFLAAVINAGTPQEHIGLICVINSQPPPSARRGALFGATLDPDARMMHVEVRNFGAFYPAE
jgi:hypothetical protein